MGVDAEAVDRLTHETGEIGAEHHDESGHEDLRSEQLDALQQIGDVGEPQAVEGDHQRGDQHHPVAEQPEQGRRVALQTGRLQEMIGAGALRQHAEVDRAQALLDREAYDFGHQPPEQDDERGQRQARQQCGALMKELTRGVDQYVNGLHERLPRIRESPAMQCPPSLDGWSVRSAVRTAPFRVRTIRAGPGPQ